MGSKSPSRADRSAPKISSAACATGVNNMTKQIAFIHTSPSVIATFKSLADELIGPRGKVFNMVDESLLCDIIGHGCCPPATAKRLVGHVLAAEQAGADII